MRYVAVLRNASLYFGVVFGAGFVLGTVRVPLLVPALGERVAELIEAPLMLLVIVAAARWLVRRHPASRVEQLAAGLASGAVVLAADLGVGVFLRDMSPAQVFSDRDPVSGAVYYALVVLFSVLPWVLAGPRNGPESAP